MTEEQALWIIEKATDLLRREPNVLTVDAPITGTYESFISTLEHSINVNRSMWRYPWTIRMLFRYIRSTVN